MKQLFLIISCLFANLLFAQQGAFNDEMLTRKMDDFLSGLVKNNGFSGAVVVMKNDREILKKGYGFADLENNIPYTPQTYSTIGSVTKQFTATAILKLEMMGKLSVNDALEKFFPEAPADKKKITLHQLLTHTAGLPPAIGDDYEPLRRDEFLARAFGRPLLSAPGENYEYSNVGYSILAAVVEQVSRMNYEAFLQKYLFKPAGMMHTGYVLPDWSQQTIATGYRDNKAWGRPNDKPWDTDGPYWNLKGNGGIISNVEEMYLWHKALLPDKILNDAEKKKLYGRHVKEGPQAETFYGYGWAIFPTPRNTWLITHNGGNGIFFCDVLRYLDENVTIIYQTNAAQRDLENIAFLLARTIFVAGFTPEIKPQAAARAFNTIEESPQGAMLQKFITAIKSGNEADIKAVVNEFFEPRFITGVPWDERLPRLRGIGKKISNATVNKVTFNGQRTEIFYTSPDGDFSYIIATENGKIAGLMLND